MNPLPGTPADQNFAAHYEQLRRDWLSRTSCGTVGLTPAASPRIDSLDARLLTRRPIAN
jgi:hypothetical protein